MSRLQQVITALEAERAETQEHLQWLEGQIAEFRSRADGEGTATGTGTIPKRSVRRSTARRASSRRATGRRLRGDMKERILDYLKDNPGSTAGDVAKGIDANRGSVGTRLSDLAKSGEVTKASKGYTLA